MTQYIDKADVVAEIERRIREIDEIGTYLSPKGVLTNLLCHLNTIEVKEVDNKNYVKNDKTKPKFKIGDWIIFDNLIINITGIVDGYYQAKSIEGTYYCTGWYKIDKYARLWTIQDAKPGDVLANDHHILILKELSYDWSSDGTPNSVKAYCGIKPNGNFELRKDNWDFCGTLNIHPATKEQRDLLFQKIYEAGYEWDSEKKDLKKIETKGGDE